MAHAVRFGRVLAAEFCLCGLLLVEGCGSGKGTVSGKVSYQGKPVPAGTVSFIPETGSPVISPIAEDGTYTIRNIAAGKVKITVETDSARPALDKTGRAATRHKGGGGGGVSQEFMKQNLEKMNPKMADPERAKRYVQIPPNYREPDKTNLTFEVKSGKQEHDIDLK